MNSRYLTKTSWANEIIIQWPPNFTALTKFYPLKKFEDSQARKRLKKYEYYEIIIVLINSIDYLIFQFGQIADYSGVF